MGKHLFSRLPLILLLALWSSAFLYLVPIGLDIMRAGAAQGSAQARLFGPCDFTVFWAVGRMAALGQISQVYHFASQLAWENANPHASGVDTLWFYPPPALLFSRLAACMAFLPAFAVWNISLLVASLALLRLAGVPWPVVAAVAICPAALLNFNRGQFGLFTAALMFSGLALSGRRPAAAGLCFGALVFKPQAALLAPVVVLAGRNWRGLGAAACLAGLLCLLSALLFGTGLWRDFFAHGLPLSRLILTAPFPRHLPPVTGSDEFYGISFFWMFRSFGWSLTACSTAQGLVTLGAAAACWHIWARAAANPVARLAVTACLSVAASPYGFMYDLCTPSIALAWLVFQERRVTLSDALLWIWPVLGVIISEDVFLELAPLVLCLSAWRAARSLQVA